MQPVGLPFFGGQPVIPMSGMGTNPMAGIASTGMMSGLGGMNFGGMSGAQLQGMGVSSSTLMLMAQISMMMAQVLSGLSQFIQQLLAAQARRQQQGGTNGSPAFVGPGSTGTGSFPANEARRSSGTRPDDGRLNLVSVSNGHRLDSEAAEAFKKANAEFRARYGRDISLVSSYRDPEHNRRVGGATNSNHLHGDAIDISMSDVDRAKPILEKYGFRQLGGTYYNPATGRRQSEDNHFDYKA